VPELCRSRGSPGDILRPGITGVSYAFLCLSTGGCQSRGSPGAIRTPGVSRRQQCMPVSVYKCLQLVLEPPVLNAQVLASRPEPPCIAGRSSAARSSGCWHSHGTSRLGRSVRCSPGQLRRRGHFVDRHVVHHRVWFVPSMWQHCHLKPPNQLERSVCARAHLDSVQTWEHVGEARQQFD
jgi:hypothetical protein